MPDASGKFKGISVPSIPWHDEARSCEFCEAAEHRPECPIGRGLERFAVVNALGGVVGHEWLSPQMAAEVREHIAERRRDDVEIARELERQLKPARKDTA